MEEMTEQEKIYKEICMTLLEGLDDYLYRNYYKSESDIIDRGICASVSMDSMPAKREMNKSSVCKELTKYDSHELTASIINTTFLSFEEKILPKGMDEFLNENKEERNFQNTLQKLIADRKLDNATVYNKAYLDRKFFSKIISTKDYIPKKHTVMALGLALELPLMEYEDFLASAGYAFMPSSQYDWIIKYCVMNKIYDLSCIDVALVKYHQQTFAKLG